jgi:ERCC4-related helicase
MMLSIEPLGLSAKQWQFLSTPEKYVEASECAGRKLVLESTRRQFVTVRDILARLNGSFGLEARRGLLLADDPGLGKTPVAAMVAWIVASAGEGRSVRILAPNDVMMRRWDEELQEQVEPLRRCAPHLRVDRRHVKARRVGRLLPGSIQVVKHSYAASDLRLACDLLIVDEAHRAKGEKTAFSKALKRQRKHAKRVLILTATPFSIELTELERMLALIDGDVARTPIRAFKRALNDLYRGSTSRDPDVVAARLAAKAQAAVEALQPLVIRHGVDDLPLEQASFGTREDWSIDVPHANPEEEELLLRMDRALRVANGGGVSLRKITNDPRFHVGWQYYDHERIRLREEVAPQLAQPDKAVVLHHLHVIDRLRNKVGAHSKMTAVATDVKIAVASGEKVLLFCHHHATAQELAAYLHARLPALTATRMPPRSAWERAWDETLPPAGTDGGEGALRATFIRWLCNDLMRSQTWTWIRSASALTEAFADTPARDPRGAETIKQAAHRLYAALMRSRSSRAVLKAAENRIELLPGTNGASRVLAVCNSSEDEREAHLFIHNQQPDTVISVFNSPFGPDVLVVTDKLSEGIDLHRYCRHLIHYELDPSPIRTVQRNGRLRRVNAWAAVTARSIRYAYPAFRGTRDHRLVQIMKKRIDSFSLLLGGVQDFEIDDVVDADERWRNDVIKLAKDRLRNAGRELRAREPELLVAGTARPASEIDVPSLKPMKGPETPDIGSFPIA